jgi:hypothetical protein
MKIAAKGKNIEDHNRCFSSRGHRPRSTFRVTCVIRYTERHKKRASKVMKFLMRASRFKASALRGSQTPLIGGGRTRSVPMGVADLYLTKRDNIFASDRSDPWVPRGHQTNVQF